MSTSLRSKEDFSVVSENSMLKFIPLPIIYYHHSANMVSPTASSTRISMSISSRLFPGGALDFESKLKRVNVTQESFLATKAMDALFSSSPSASSSSSSPNSFAISTNVHENRQLTPEDIVDADSLVIRVMYAGAFTNGSFENNGKNLPSERGGSRKVKSKNLQSKLQHLALSSNFALSREKQMQQQQSNQRPVNIFETIVSNAASSSSSENKNNNNNTATPGLSFVGRVLAAGKNVHFSNEWVPEPEATSILPRGFKEGDLVCGLQCDKAWLRGDPLRGSAGTYIVVPACFVMRIPSSSIIFAGGAPKNGVASNSNNNNVFELSQHQKQQQQQSLPSSTSLYSVLAANLLPAVLWYSLLKWHVDPKQDESILFVSLKSFIHRKRNSINSRGDVQFASSSCSSCLPALGAVLCSVLELFRDRHEKNHNADHIKNEKISRANPIAIVSTCEEDTKLLRKFEEYVRTNSSFAMNNDAIDEFEEERNDQKRLFDIVEVFRAKKEKGENSLREDASDLRKFQHVVVSHDFSCSIGEVDDDDEEEESDNDNENSDGDDGNGNDNRNRRINEPGSNLVPAKFLFRCLAENGTIGYLKNQVSNSKNKIDRNDDDFDDSSFVTSTLLPLVIAKHGRLAFMSTQALFESPAERVRRSIIEVVSLFVSAELCIPPPSRVIKPDQKLLEPLLKQYKNFIANSTSDNNNNNETVTGNNLHSNQVEWFGFGDRVGAVVCDMLNKNLGGLQTALENRSRQRKQNSILLLTQNSENDDGDLDQLESDERERLHTFRLLSKFDAAVQSSDVLFENGLNSLVIQFPTNVA